MQVRYQGDDAAGDVGARGVLLNDREARRSGGRGAETLTLTTPPLPSAPQQARDMALSAVLAWSLPVDPDELCLVTGELVANAVTHAGTTLGVRIRTRGGAAVRVEVTDRDVRPPTLFAPGRSDESHWGMVVVAALASRWGYERLTTGKVVWAEVDFAAEPVPLA